MSPNDIPAPDNKTLEDLKAQLNAFVEQSAIANFDGDDIIELVEEGEEVGWIVDQMKGNRTDIDVDGITALLSEIAGLIGPPERAESSEEENEAFEPAAEQEEEPSTSLDLSSLDPGRIDLEEIVKSLPPGMKLPPGMGLKQLKDLIESPQAKMMSDFLLFCQEKGVDINEGTMNDPRTGDLENEWKSTPREAFGGKRPDEMLEEHPELMPGKVETFRREEPRVGRNDPCPCGSGKKYKKCCGKG